MARPNKRRSFRQVVNCDLELRPLMNVFIVLIPMLLMSAVFMEIRVIEMTLPPAAQAAEPNPEKRLDLTIRIRAADYVVEGNGVATQAVARTSAAADSTSASEAAQLTDILKAVEADHPDNRDVRIVAESGTRYREIVAPMDLARAAGLPQAALEGATSGGM